METETIKKQEDKQSEKEMKTDKPERPESQGRRLQRGWEEAALAPGRLVVGEGGSKGELSYQTRT